MKDFIFRMPTKIRFGVGSTQNIGSVLKDEMGYQKAFVATDKGIVNAGIIAKIEEGLQAGDMEYVIYDELIPEPTVEVVDQAAEVLRESGADVVIAVGGGSPIDTAKAMCLLQTHEGLLMCDKEAIEVQKILPFLSDTWPLCRIGRAVIRASQSCRQSCNKSQCPACGCRSHHSCTHAPQFSRSFPAREWGSVLQRQGACGQCP